MQIRIHRKDKDAPLPRYMSPGASGMDLHAVLAEPLVIYPGKRGVVPTGLTLAIPEGYEAQIRPRSGLALEHGITVLNAPGTVDSDYRGEIKVILVNLGDQAVEIRGGMRVAQMVVARVEKAEFVEVPEAENLPGTGRNDGGFGHTGV
jgi:dUTP pyrophosphatase